jgi:hypothetical protein
VANNENLYPLTVEEAVDSLHANISLNDEIRLAATLTEDDLSNFHFSLGHYIRNEFGLWSGNHALLESCRIMAGKQDLHVDDASSVIIKALWVRLKKEDRLNIIESRGNYA